MKARFNKIIFLVCAISILMCSVVGALANVGYGKKGDVDNNGVIESMDYILAKRAYFGTFRLEGNAVKRADINNNGEIDSTDYLLTKRAYFGTYNIEEKNVNASDTVINATKKPVGSTTKEYTPADFQVPSTSENTELLEEAIRYYLNQYRIKEGNCVMQMINIGTKARAFARGRGEQLQFNYAHDTWERRALATELEFGDYFPEEDETIFNFETNKVEYTGGTIPAYYEPYGSEAISKCIKAEGTPVDEIGKALAQSFYNSPSHWRYVGADSNPYVAIGVSTCYAGGVCVCVLVYNENGYTLNDDLYIP